MIFTSKLNFMRKGAKTENLCAKPHSVAEASPNNTYRISEIATADKEMKDFLFTLGCYVGEQVTVISKLAGNVVIVVKDARYSIDAELAKAIVINQCS